ncbi:MAG: hypothetical protein AB2A00_22950 [Myxococcota bacterium]
MVSEESARQMRENDRKVRAALEEMETLLFQMPSGTAATIRAAHVAVKLLAWPVSFVVAFAPTVLLSNLLSLVTRNHENKLADAIFMIAVSGSFYAFILLAFRARIMFVMAMIRRMRRTLAASGGDVLSAGGSVSSVAVGGARRTGEDAQE